jgi:hypothetical protein
VPSLHDAVDWIAEAVVRDGVLLQREEVRPVVMDVARFVGLKPERMVGVLAAGLSSS